MDDTDITRSIRLVSLDTHPANNALVVTYEILVVASERRSGQELMRRTKRDQLHINISMLDQQLNKLSQSPTNPLARTTLNLRQLSEKIVDKCPILNQFGEGQDPLWEEIQLHLLYLFNRKQAQLLMSRHERPPSATTRLRSDTPSSRTTSSRRCTSSLAGSRSDSSDGVAIASTIHETFRDSELRASMIASPGGCPLLVEALNRVDEFVEYFDRRLGGLEAQLDQTKLHTGSVEAQLESLYGQRQDKMIAVAVIRQHVRNDLKLAALGENRLLICALLRTLKEEELLGSILFYLVRFTQYEDIYRRLFSSSDNSSEPVDLFQVVRDLLEERVTALIKLNDAQQTLANFYELNALLVIMNNLLNLDETGRLKSRAIQEDGKCVAAVIVGLYSLMSDQIISDIKQQKKDTYERLTLILMETTCLAQRLSVYREFILHLRAKSQLLVESLGAILNALQLCQPNGGSNQSINAKRTSDTGQFLVKDQQILTELYALEIQILRLVNNLVHDPRLRMRFMHKNILLKCVLRNLVVFLASSRRSNSLASFDKSAVLLVPFRCLYELSCSDLIQRELFKSKLIIKCLLEYLLSASADLNTLIDSLIPRTNPLEATGKASPHSRLMCPVDEQILVEPTRASYYVVALWVNLSANKSAPFYDAQTIDAELCEPLIDYIELTTTNLVEYQNKSREMKAAWSGHSAEAEMILYFNMKLLRNMTQFLGLFHKEPVVWIKFYVRLVERMAALVDRVLENSDYLEMGAPMTVELVAILANLIEKSDAFRDIALASPQDSVSPKISSIIRRLFSHKLVQATDDLNGELDDLLLVSINFLGTLARKREICLLLKIVCSDVVNIITLVLESKGNDIEMLISSLYTLKQLVGHAAFLETLNSIIEELSEEKRVKSPQFNGVEILIDKLGHLMMHADMSVVKLTNYILNRLKQFEEQQSLNDSYTWRRRFECYNAKWLSAIKTSGDDCQSPNLMEGLTNFDTNEEGSEPNEEAEMIDEINQLRAISDDAQSEFSTASSNDNKLIDNDMVIPVNGMSKNNDAGGNEDSQRTRLDWEGDDLEDEEEISFSEPDLDVIDCNSMIKHLTNRREFRSDMITKRH